MNETAPQPQEQQTQNTSLPPAPKSPLILFITVGFIVLLLIGGLLELVISSKAKKTDSTLVITPTVQIITLTPTVPLVEEYNNPFDEKSQYQNPFEQSDNPFDSLAQ